jgi:hypothetical protein
MRRGHILSMHLAAALVLGACSGGSDQERCWAGSVKATSTDSRDPWSAYAPLVRVQ